MTDPAQAALRLAREALTKAAVLADVEGAHDLMTECEEALAALSALQAEGVPMTEPQIDLKAGPQPVGDPWDNFYARNNGGRVA